MTAASRHTAPPNWPTALGLPAPTDEQAAVIAAPPGPLVVIAGAGAGKTETMAARVVWLVANGYADPGQVLGLTFTRKAAGQLLRRVRSRLARLAGPTWARDGHSRGSAGRSAPTTRSPVRCCASTACCCRSSPTPGCSAKPSCGSWLSRWSAVIPVRCDTDKNPAARHRDGAAAVRSAGRASGRHRPAARHPPRTRAPGAHLPAGPLPARPRPQPVAAATCWAPRPNAPRWCRSSTPCTRGCGPTRRWTSARRWRRRRGWPSACPQVGEQLRDRYRVVLLDEYQDTGHAQRIALSSLFGGGVDDGLALTAVGDPIQSIYGWRGASATNLPRFTTDFPRADGTPAPDAGAAHQLAQPAEHAAGRQRGVGRGAPPVGRGACAAGRARAPSPARCAAHCCSDVATEREWVADHIAARYPRRPGRRRRRRPPRCWCAATPTPVRSPRRCGPAGVPVEVVGLAGLLSIPEVADVVAMLRLVADPAAGAAAVRVLTGPRWQLGARDLAALWRRAVRCSTGRGRRPRPPSRSSRRPRPTPTSRAWPTPWRSGPGRRVFGRGLSADLRTRRRADRAAGASRPPGHRPGRRGASRPRRRRGGGPRDGRRGGRHRTPRRVRRRRRRLRRPARRRRARVCWHTSTPPTIVENGLAPAEVERGDRTGCRCSPCTPPRGSSGRSWPCRTCPAAVFPSTASARTWLTDAGRPAATAAR